MELYPKGSIFGILLWNKMYLKMIDLIDFCKIYVVGTVNFKNPWIAKKRLN